MMKKLTGVLFVFTLLLAAQTPAAPLQHRSDKMFRTVNTDTYEIGVRKNGETDVTLTSRDPVFIGAIPMVWYDGAEAPEPFRLSGKLSGRDAVNNRMGQGQGLLLQEDNCDWMLQAYPTKPYMSAQVAFVNTGKKSVKIKMLIPWSTAGFTLGPSTDQSVILENGRSCVTNGDVPQKVTGSSLSQWSSAVYNAFTKRTLIAGFVTSGRAYTQIRLERADKGDSTFFDLCRAECVYDPAIEVQPGERLESEVLYLGVAEANPFDGVERYGATFAAFNNIKHRAGFLPHGWDSWNTKYETDINEERMLSALDFMDHNLKRYGWKHFAIDAGWEIAKGDWEPNPARFPNGMKWMAEQIHAKGMTAGIRIDPFTVDVNSAFAKAHPNWLRTPSEEGAKNLKETDRILDVSIPDAYDYTRELFEKIGSDWKYDALQECDFVYHLLYADSYADTGLTRIDVLHRGMQAVREGFGANRLITSFTPLPATGIYCDAMRIGDDCAPLWRKSPENRHWGCVEAMTNAAHRYYYAPSAWATDTDCAYFGHAETSARWKLGDKPALTREQATTWFTAAALTGGVVKVGDWLPDLSADEVALLSRLLPTLQHPARPVDLFEREIPCVWSLPVRCAIGQWTIVGVFNWDETANHKTRVSFEELGLDPNVYYTVYDFWKDTFHGLAQGHLNVDTNPGSCHLLGLRRHENHPMFLSTDRHFSQGATDFKSLVWNATTRQLEGVFDGVADTDYNLRVYVPEGYGMKSVAVSTGNATPQMDGKVLKIGFHCTSESPVTWSVQF